MRTVKYRSWENKEDNVAKGVIQPMQINWCVFSGMLVSSAMTQQSDISMSMYTTILLTIIVL